MNPTATPLMAALIELEHHVGEQGWDQPPRLFAIADSAGLLLQEPALAEQLGLSAESASLTSIEQEGVPADRPLEEMLAQIVWPDSVTGCALVVERIVLPPGAEQSLPEQDSDAVAYAVEHPERSDVRLVGGVLRDGTRYALLRVKGHEAEGDLLTGEQLAPGLLDALAGTLAE